MFELKNRNSRAHQALKPGTALHESRAQNVRSGYTWESLREQISTLLRIQKRRMAISGSHSTGSSQARCWQGFGKLPVGISASAPGAWGHPSLHLPCDTQHLLPFHRRGEAAPTTGELWGEDMAVVARAGTPGCGCGLDLSLGPQARPL